jgi:hypothetical protein
MVGWFTWPTQWIWPTSSAKATPMRKVSSTKATPMRKVSLGESQCQQVLASLFPGYTFTTVRPNFLRNPTTGRNLELDFYCPELNLALEYQGEQHYRFNPVYHNSVQDFYGQLERDRIKQELCTRHGVTLIQVPHSVGSIRDYLKWLVEQHPEWRQSWVSRLLTPSQWKMWRWFR